MPSLHEIDRKKLLQKRIINEIREGNIDEASYLIDTYIFLSIEQTDAPTELIGAISTQAHIFIKQKELQKAEVILQKALLIEPENQDILYTLTQLKKLQQYFLTIKGITKKSLATKFMKKYEPQSTGLVQEQWNEISNMSIEEYQERHKNTMELIERTQTSLLSTKQNVEDLLNKMKSTTHRFVLFLNYISQTTGLEVPYCFEEEKIKTLDVQKASEHLGFPEYETTQFVDFLKQELSLPRALRSFLSINVEG